MVETPCRKVVPESVSGNSLWPPVSALPETIVSGGLPVTQIAVGFVVLGECLIHGFIVE